MAATRVDWMLFHQIEYVFTKKRSEWRRKSEQWTIVCLRARTAPLHYEKAIDTFGAVQLWTT